MRTDYLKLMSELAGFLKSEGTTMRSVFVVFERFGALFWFLLLGARKVPTFGSGFLGRLFLFSSMRWVLESFTE